MKSDKSPPRQSANPLDSVNQNLQFNRLKNDEIEDEANSILRSIKPTRRSASTRSLLAFDYNPNKTPTKSIFKTPSHNTNINRRRDLSQLRTRNKRQANHKYNITDSRERDSELASRYSGMERSSPVLLRSRSAKRHGPTVVKMRDSSRRGMKVRFKDAGLENVIMVENWKILNVDMSKEGKMYNRYNRGGFNTREDGCTVF